MLSRWRRRRTIDRASPAADSGVSVVINTLNRCELLEQVLDALHDQRFRDFEVIVVNGPSTDGTEAMLRERGDAFRLVPCDVASLGVSRNLGIRHAACPIVAFTDDDAIPDPTWLERLVPLFDDAMVGAAGGPVFDVPLGRVEWKICTCTRLGANRTDSPPPIDQYLGVGADPFVYLAGCNMAFRRSVLREIGGFNPLFAYGYDDVEVCMRVVDLGYTIAYDEGALVTHHRASSAVRDERQEIQDPYPIAHARTVFALQSQRSSTADTGVEAEMRAWMADWRSALAASDREAPTDFFERFEAGILDAIASGPGRRQHVEVGGSPMGEYRRFAMDG